MEGVRIEIQLPTSTAKGARPFSVKELVNVYPESATNAQERSKFQLKNAIGLAPFVTFSRTGSCRGMIEAKDTFFTIYGNTLYEVNSSGSSIRGTIPGTGHVPMAYSSSELAIAADNSGYIFNITTNTLTKITDAAFLPPRDVTFIDGYFVWLANNSTGNGQVVFTSNLYDGLSYDALDRIATQRAPDNNVAIDHAYSEVWVFGSETIEFLANVGAASPPFAPVGNTVLEIGCASTASVVKVPNEGILWLGNDRLIYQRGRNGLQDVTPHEIANEIATYSRVNDVVAWYYSQGKHKFYVISFPAAEKTFVYDIFEQAWHSRETHGENYWRGQYSAKLGQVTYIGDAFDNVLFIGNSDTHTDGAVVIRKEFTTPEIHAEDKAISLTRLEFHVRTGDGAYTGNDTIRLYASEDHGRTFQKLGEQPFAIRGNGRQRVIFNHCGRYDSGVVLKVQTAVQSPFEVLAAYADIEVLDA